jgi:hypothetical protein
MSEQKQAEIERLRAELERVQRELRELKHVVEVWIAAERIVRGGAGWQQEEDAA